MLATTLRIVRLTKLAIDALQEKAVTAMIPKKLKSTMENSEDSVNPKPLVVGIAQEHPRQLAPSMRNLLVQGTSSAAPIMSAMFPPVSPISSAPTSSSSRNSIRCGSFEFTPHNDASRSVPSGLRGGVDATFGSVHFIIDSGGFLRLPGSVAPGMERTATPPTVDVPPLTTIDPPYSLSNNDESNQRYLSNIGSRQEHQKRRRDLHYQEIDHAASCPYQYGDQDEGHYDERSTRSFHGIIPTLPAYPLGKISLDVVFGTPDNFRKERLEFEVVDWESQYHAILGRPAFAKFMAVPHYAYLKLKMPGNNGTMITVHGSFSRFDNCDKDFQKIASKSGVREELNALDILTNHKQPPADNRNTKSDEFDAAKEAKKHQPSDMPGIPRELAEHALNVDPKAKPVQQTLRHFSEPKRKAIGEEVKRLRKVGFIRELKEAKWVANPVMVPKKDTTALRMCIDFTSLNKHCPKDHFPLPRIDQIVDSTAGCHRLSFLDAYSGYNQIKLKEEDQELMAFITPHGVYCYNVMTSGLKNAGATYQRCMQACLGEQIGRNIKVYIDDIVVKTRNAATLIDDLRETFSNLDRYKIKLNPKKCFFGVPGGQVLGYFISARGIEANPLKIKAVLDMEPPRNLQQVHQLAGRVVALGRFIAKLAEKALPFYQLMKKSEKFEWIAEAQDAFDDLKKVLSTSPVLVTPHDREPMLLYIAATNQVVSIVLIVEHTEAGKVHGVQRPVNYLSEVLTPTKQRYPHYQKLAYAIWMTSRKLRHYFAEHLIVVVTEAPLKNILTNPDDTGRVPQWAIELAPHDISYVN
ncbi:hypothetical protein QYE76_025732 [Lolium multiflorum]|uniref:Uncharacterized protein n=1 Tax=Lolium multiflorum TaxID=4521 RepID=A0AAD8RG53_LOLMU|nr:hypothetical protein QYE76_025732 [Lolium multiflorum]